MNCKQVARDLGLNECVIGYVSIECIDDPVSIAVRRMDRDVANITLSIGIPSDIQPKSSLSYVNAKSKYVSEQLYWNDDDCN